jgi:hypothetical protein
MVSAVSSQAPRSWPRTFERGGFHKSFDIRVAGGLSVVAYREGRNNEEN